MLYKHANSEWLFNLNNPTQGVKLEKPDNNIERYWEGKDEKAKLIASIEQYRPNLKNLVLLCLELAFRIGELLPKAMQDKHGNEINSDKGLFWSNVNFETNEIKLTHEKNDHTKRNTELKGRTVPLSNVAKKILLEIYNKQENPKPTDRVFPFSYNTARPQLDYCCEKAGIEKFTFHSTRKIGTVDIGFKVSNVLQQAKITGHKTIQILSDRYYKPDIADLKAMLDEIETDNPILRGFLVLEKHLGKDLSEEFIKFVQKTKADKNKPVVEQLKILCDRPALEEVVRNQ